MSVEGGRPSGGSWGVDGGGRVRGGRGLGGGTVVLVVLPEEEREGEGDGGGSVSTPRLGEFTWGRVGG